MDADQLDKWNLEQFDTLYPDIKARAVRVYQDMFRTFGVRMRCTRGFASIEEQAKLYAQGRTVPGPVVTYAMPAKSMHNYALAFDSCFAGGDPYLEYLGKRDPAHAKELWEAFGSLCEARGLAWGGRWLDEKQDMPHAQKTYGLNLAQIQALHGTGGMPAVFATLNEMVRIGRRNGVA